MTIDATDVSAIVDDLEAIVAIRPAIDRFRHNPFYWSTLLGIPVERLAVAIEAGDELVKAAGAVLEGQE